MSNDQEIYREYRFWWTDKLDTTAYYSKTLKEAKKEIREYLGVKRLPNIWFVHRIDARGMKVLMCNSKYDHKN